MSDTVVIRDDFREPDRQRLEDLSDEQLRALAVSGSDEAALIWARRQQAQDGGS